MEKLDGIKLITKKIMTDHWNWKLPTGKWRKLSGCEIIKKTWS